MKSISQKYVAEFVYGATDGTITTFAVVAGALGAGLSPTIVLVLGYANLLADGFSMAASNYLSHKTEDGMVTEALRKMGIGKLPLFTSAVTFLSFVSIGSVPLSPFIIGAMAGSITTIHFIFSGIMTGVAFLFIGYMQGSITKTKPIFSALQTLAIGGVASVIAFFTGRFIESLF